MILSEVIKKDSNVSIKIYLDEFLKTIRRNDIISITQSSTQYYTYITIIYEKEE